MFIDKYLQIEAESWILAIFLYLEQYYRYSPKAIDESSRNRHVGKGAPWIAVVMDNCSTEKESKNRMPPKPLKQYFLATIGKTDCK
jgi:hypothetical protein